ncbi:MAG: copper homeostasis protein CutC [Propionibacteriaceae bacterium]|nr:copper homeostasis protein CutC [Propionibacteriaceae bacterium]
MGGILHIRVRTPYEAQCAEEGGADRLIAMSDENLSPEPETVSKIRKASSVHLQVLLQLRTSYDTDGAEVTRLKGLASSYLDAGADSFQFGFLNAMAELDRGVCTELAGDQWWNWTLTRAIDHALNQQRAWADIWSLPRLESVMTAGCAREVEQGLDHIIAAGDERLIVAGDLLTEHIPWLIRGGLRQFYVEPQSMSAPIVRAWRRLIDEETARLG